MVGAVIAWLKANPAQITAVVLFVVRLAECIEVVIQEKPKNIVEFIVDVVKEFGKFN